MFNILLKDDFTKLSGLVAEAIYRRKPNYRTAKCLKKSSLSAN